MIPLIRTTDQRLIKLITLIKMIRDNGAVHIPTLKQIDEQLHEIQAEESKHLPLEMHTGACYEAVTYEVACSALLAYTNELGDGSHTG